MDYNKLIERLYQHDKDYGEGRTQNFFRVCLDCKDAATALSTLQAENAQLRADLEYEREHANAYHEECGQWEDENEKLRAELEQVKRERDAAKSPEVLEAVDELMEFSRTRMSIGGWLCYVNVLGEWRGPQKEE